MSIKDTLTNNSMNSFSFGGKTYTRRVDNGAVVYDISAGTDGAAFSTGWVDEDAVGTDVANGATLTFNHNLGTTDLVVDIYVSANADGSNPQDFQRGHASGTSNAYGGGVTNVTENALEIQLASQGYLDLDSSGQVTTTSFSGKYIKVVVSAKMGSGGGGGTPAGADRQLQFNDNGTFGANANLKFDGSTVFIPRLVVGEGNFAGDEGGEMALRQSETNNTLEGNWIYMDSHKNLIRFFEDGAPYKGAYIDLSQCADGVGTNLLAGGSGGSGGYGGFIDSGTFITQGGDNHTFPDFDANTQVVFAVRDGLGDDLTELVADGSTQTLLGGSGNGYSGSPGARVTLTSAGVTTGSDTLSGNSWYTIKVYRFTRSGGGGGGGGASVTTDETAPTNPSDGDLWYDEDGAALYVYTDSIGGWIQANGGGGGGTSPRAYVAFDGTQQGDTLITASITNSFNVSSVTDDGTGMYTVNFTTPIANPVPITAGMANHTINPIDTSILNPSSNSVQIIMGTNSAGKIDYPGVYLVVF